ncbi:MAG: hypothetical protein NTY68_05710 [Candidatus Micrarchaeota archaeon]|nr:hypothetical protein [Candidatus Micrarchaeota archaeon]
MEQQIGKEVERINGILGAKGMTLYTVKQGASYSIFLEKASDKRTIKSMLCYGISELECFLLLSNTREIKRNNFSGIARCF